MPIKPLHEVKEKIGRGPLESEGTNTDNKMRTSP